MPYTKSNTDKNSKLLATLVSLKAASQSEQHSYLAKVKYKPQVELLERILLQAKSKRANAIDERCWITKDRPTVAEDADYADYPFPQIDKYILEDFSTLLKKDQIPGLKEPLDKLTYLIWDTIRTYDRASLGTPKQILLLKAIIKSLKSKQFSDNKLVEKILSSINYWSKDWKIVNRLGLSDLPALINALKEYIKCISNNSKQPQSNKGKN